MKLVPASTRIEVGDGSIEVQPLRIDPGEEFFFARSTRTANGRLGKISSQTMGRRAHIQVTIRVPIHRGETDIPKGAEEVVTESCFKQV